MRVCKDNGLNGYSSKTKDEITILINTNVFNDLNKL